MQYVKHAAEGSAEPYQFPVPIMLAVSSKKMHAAFQPT